MSQRKKHDISLFYDRIAGNTIALGFRSKHKEQNRAREAGENVDDA
jgi:hypothetical protein